MGYDSILRCIWPGLSANIFLNTLAAALFLPLKTSVTTKALIRLVYSSQKPTDPLAVFREFFPIPVSATTQSLQFSKASKNIVCKENRKPSAFHVYNAPGWYNSPKGITHAHEVYFIYESMTLVEK